jgi:endonuclease III
MARNETTAYPVLKKRRISRPPATSGKAPRPGAGQDLRQLPKKPFDIEAAIVRIRAAVKPFPKAALFELYDRGFTSVFEQLVACIISIRTMDEVTVPTAESLFQVARTPAQVAKMTPAQIDRRIGSCTFHGAKAKSIHKIAIEAVSKYGGELPCDDAVLTELPGVGPKCANLALGIACGQGGIGVDIHVHRVTNRWGYVDAPTPEKTMAELEGKLPREHWVEINKLLVPFGKHVCTGKRPHCSTCPVLNMCLQIGVTDYR